MKKKMSIILCIVFSVILPIMLMSACGKYLPATTEHYFKDGDVYRVFSANAGPKHVENYALDSFTIPMIGSTSAKADISDCFTANSMFFGNPNVINKEGVIAIYDYLDISSYKLADEYYACYTTDIFTYNKKIEYATTTSVTLDLTDKPNLTVIGEVANVDIYTFDYEDRSVNDGSVVKNGSFDIIISKFSYVSTFIAYQ